MLIWLVAVTTGLFDHAGRPFCDRGAPQPIGFHARGFGYVAEVFPPKSRHNTGSRPIAYLYSVAYPGSEWRVDARRLWTAVLRNSQMPQSALVSMAGHVVALDDYYQSGGEHALDIYDVGGRFVRSYSLEQLLDAVDLARVTFSYCGRPWRDGAMFYFTTGDNARLYVLFPWQRVLELTLATGELRRGAVRDFPRLRDITARASPNEQAEPWSISLRFSSLTDFVIVR